MVVPGYSGAIPVTMDDTEVYHTEEGCIKIPDTPGLGIDLNFDAFEKYPQRFTPQGFFRNTLYKGYTQGAQKDFGKNE